MLEVARWFTDESALLEPLLSVCRIKNKFALGQDQLVGGYRDLMLCVLTENPDGLCIIGEVQVTTHPYVHNNPILSKNYVSNNEHNIFLSWLKTAKLCSTYMMFSKHDYSSSLHYNNFKKCYCL
jgi:hypothetical protein